MKQMRYLHVKHKKLPIISVFTWFLILGKIQDGSQDGDHVWWRHRPPTVPPPLKYSISCREDERLSIEGKIFLVILQHVKDLWQGFYHRPPPPPLYHGGDITLFVRPGVKWVIHFDAVDFCVKKSTQGEILGWLSVKSFVGWLLILHYCER